MQKRLKIGITESNDASACYDWISKLEQIDGAILITKNITDKFIDEVLQHKEKLVIHVSCTGFGGTIVEPRIPNYKKQLNQAFQLVKKGFPIENLVIRIDPLIPIKDCLDNLSYIINEVRSLFVKIDKDWNLKLRFRISILDLYPHVKERFKKLGLSLPYDGEFQPSDGKFKEVDNYLSRIEFLYNIKFEACAEPKLKNVKQTGCVSIKDIELLNLDISQFNNEYKHPRKHCLCCTEKTELLPYGSVCPYGCAYCYWKQNGNIEIK